MNIQDLLYSKNNLNDLGKARLTAIQEVPGSIPGYTLEIFLEV